MEKWIRCNKCYRSNEESSSNFVLTQCQHIFCSQCIIAVEEKCPECKSVGVSTMTLENPLQQSLIPYFCSISEHLEQTIQAADLQRTQALIILRRSREIEEKYDYMKKLYGRATSYEKGLNSALKELREEMQKLSHRLAKYRSHEKAIHESKMGTLSNSLSYNSGRRHQEENRDSKAYRYIAEPPGSNSQCFYYKEKAAAQSIMRQEILSRENFQRRDRNSGREESCSNLRSSGRNFATFTPVQYQPRAILSNSSAGSPITPAGNPIRKKIPGSVQSSSNLSSQDGTPNIHFRINYLNNRT